MRTVLYIFAFVVLVSIHETCGEFEECTQQYLDGSIRRYLHCSYGCCGNEYIRYCCEYVPYSMSGGVIAAIVIGCIIFVAIIVGVILCCVCCAKAASSSGTTTRGAVIMSPAPQIAMVTQGTTNNAYAPPPLTAYNMPQPQYATTELKY